MRHDEHYVEWNEKQISRLWDHYTKTSSVHVNYFAKQCGREILKWCGVPLKERLEVLDFGSGPGFIWNHLRNLKAKWHYTALDFSSESIAQIEKNAKGFPQFGGAFHAEKLPTPFNNEQFDVVLLIEVVEHLKSDILDATLREIHRIMRPGGVLLITTPNNEDLSRSMKFCPDCGAIFHEWQHVRAWDVVGLEKELKTYGFTVKKIKTLNFMATRWWVRIVWQLAKVFSLKVDPHMIALFRKV